ncbi:hypothetical protein GE061_005422 [Apolygus lucorum]|uniref:Uncharacterized protein n=1 Tax=Apolygus lucorum TaxID=248454 RepID=A0A8S9X074_APOLU|nr:hypothetical protein GE061_005422 [Apolygus lucorum]
MVRVVGNQGPNEICSVPKSPYATSSELSAAESIYVRVVDTILRLGPKDHEEREKQPNQYDDAIASMGSDLSWISAFHGVTGTLDYMSKNFTLPLPNKDVLENPVIIGKSLRSLRSCMKEEPSDSSTFHAGGQVKRVTIWFRVFFFMFTS